MSKGMGRSAALIGRVKALGFKILGAPSSGRKHKRRSKKAQQKPRKHLRRWGATLERNVELLMSIDEQIKRLHNSYTHAGDDVVRKALFERLDGRLRAADAIQLTSLSIFGKLGRLANPASEDASANDLISKIKAAKERTLARKRANAVARLRGMVSLTSTTQSAPVAFPKEGKAASTAGVASAG